MIDGNHHEGTNDVCIYNLLVPHVFPIAMIFYDIHLVYSTINCTVPINHSTENSASVKICVEQAKIIFSYALNCIDMIATFTYRTSHIVTLTML